MHSHVYNAHEVFGWQPQIFYIFKPYLLFHMYDPLSIPYLAYEVFTAIYKNFTFGSHTCP